MSKLCNARVHKRHEDMRLQRLRDMKPQIDAKPPKVCGMPHLKHNFKRDEVLGCRYDEIERDNRHLLNKMTQMVKEKGLCTPNHSRSAPNLSTAHDNRFPGGPSRRNEIARIEHENSLMLHRLQNARAEYRTKEWEAAHDESKKIMKRLCNYPIVLGLKRRSRPAASLIPLAAERDPHMQAGLDPGAVAPGYGSPTAQGLRYVFKEHLMIGGVTYFVEMATDGQTLAISAYDQDIQDTLETLINEDHHRQLFHESNGDYGRIASRLRIIDGGLAIIPLEAYNESQELASPPDVTPASYTQ